MWGNISESARSERTSSAITPVVCDNTGHRQRQLAKSRAPLQVTSPPPPFRRVGEGQKARHHSTHLSCFERPVDLKRLEVTVLPVALDRLGRRAQPRGSTLASRALAAATATAATIGDVNAVGERCDE